MEKKKKKKKKSTIQTLWHSNNDSLLIIVSCGTTDIRERIIGSLKDDRKVHFLLG